MTDLPTGWAATTLGEVAEVIAGQAPPGTTYNTSGVGLPLFQGKTDFSDLYIGRARLWTTRPSKLAQPDDVLLSVRAPVGPTNLARDQCAIGRGLAAVRGRPGISQRYLLYAIRNTASALERRATGTTFAAITASVIRSHPIQLAPTAEQERIVAAIEEQFSRLDAGTAALERVVSRVERMARAVILAAIPKNVPATWTLTTVGAAGQVQLGRQRSPRFHTGPNMKPYLRVANVFEDRIDTSDVMAMHFSESEFRQYELKHGDILLNEGQSPHLLGRPAMYRGDPPGVAFTNSLLRFQAKDGILPAWALLVFRRHLHSRRFMAESQITTNIAHLSAGRFKTIEFPVPPVEEQHRIVADVDEQLSAAYLQQSSAERSLELAKRLRSAILSAAFSGRLVPQDPAEEPAAILLDRIAAQRASSNGHKTINVRTPRVRRRAISA